jgi:phosphoribosylformimino-5-aminoimidazole carboxamide ribotide isomerase
MIIIPAIDLKESKCVRLYKGEFSKIETVSLDPVKTAFEFKEEGAEFIHIVDLDGAVNGEPSNLNIIKEIVKNVDVPIELGGGIRNIGTIEKLVSYGISRIILGTAALKDTLLVKEAVELYGSKIAVGIDVRDENVAVSGWLETSKTNYLDFAKEMENLGVSNLIVTDISRDGTLKGSNIKMIENLKKKLKLRITASGGVKAIEDIKMLKKLDIYGVITGKALYSGSLNLRDAIAEARDNNLT